MLAERNRLMKAPSRGPGFVLSGKSLGIKAQHALNEAIFRRKRGRRRNARIVV
jgi:hypothetical protein